MTPHERDGDVREFVGTLPLAELREQAARCMECGVPFCHGGCPLGNLIPDWNDLVYRDGWREAIKQLHRTNNFPEFTGRLCPAPCEAACVLEIQEGDAVTIKQVERAIVDRAWDEGWIVPRPAQRATGRSVAVVGSGPAGLACAQQLARAGERVVVYERDEAAGGLVRFGVPEFKIEKRLVERRVDQLRARASSSDLASTYVRLGAASSRRHDAVVLAVGARVPRDLPVPGRELPGVHFAMEYLYDGRARSRVRTWGRAHRRGQARHRHRRRRHRRRLRRARAPRGRGVRHADRARRRAACSRPDDAHAMAAVADEAAHVVRAEGGRRARLRDLDDAVLRCGRPTVEQIHWQRNAGVPPFEFVEGTEEVAPCRARAARDGVHRPGAGLLEARVERDGAEGGARTATACSSPATRGVGSR